MTTPSSDYFDVEDHGGVTIVRVVADAIRHPGQAEQFGKDLATLVAHDGRKRLVLDFRECDYLGSTAFAVILGLAKRVAEAGGSLAIFGFRPDVLTGALIISMDKIIPIFDHEKQALDAV